MKLYNSLSRQVEEFKPLNPPKVGMYTCGPTVYGHQHIGNFRTMILGDLLYRVLTANGYQVKTVRNITDIEDKIIKKAAELNMSIADFTKEYSDLYFDDLLQFNILPVDVSPRATEHIGKMIKYIEELIKKGVAYERDSSVYFDISKYPDYGKLSRLDQRELKSGTRVLSDEYEKDAIGDFALWKSVNPDQFGYDSPWGKGRPGWHIECSVMSQEYLGDTLDIHVGGKDLMFPHHENEIAQSEAKTSKKFVNFFVHGEFIQIDGKKMSKSLKNVYELKDLVQKNFEPLAYRYLCLTSHYRTELNFTWESLEAAQTTLDRLRDEIRLWDQPETNTTQFYQKFLESANNDLSLPQAVAVMWEMVRSDNTTSSKSADLLAMDKILGLSLEEYLGKPIEVPEEINKLVQQREEARANKDFDLSDKLRHQIKTLGFEVEDTETGPKVKKS